ncbi:hypothetical protein Cantr_07981 [Candida viswanathii]|uniref:Kinesin motor domain-containing protein n=1 Tax=Candida viswanathii TaxID=5486 RepID=A0A367Y3U9_9ASCO|nr:hypothetical protein Cantr_07981 [Candida viswanathii]
MASIPLFLKVKGSATTPGESPHFHQISETTISFNETEYSFEHVFDESNHAYSQLINDTSNSCILLMGPTASGKTTMLKQLVAGKASTFDGPAFVTAFEISKNKHVTDLLDTSLSEFKHVQNFESTLKRVKFSHDVWKQICKTRATQATEFNAHSSRSCLVITFYYHNARTTFIDLMGNEKKGVAVNNAFANLNNSAITQLLVNPKNVRSDNLITNFIFKHQNLKFVLNLDPYGNPSLTKSSLTNVAELVKNFKPPAAAPTTETTKLVRRAPSYTRPTVSSSRHSPVKIVAKRSRVVTISPEKIAIKRVRLKSNPTGRSLDSNPFIEKNSKLYLKSLAQRSTSTDTVADDYAEQIEVLKNEKQELRNKYVQSIKEIKQDFIDFKEESTGLLRVLASLEATINQLRQDGLDMQSEHQEQINQLVTAHDSEIEDINHNFEATKSELIQQHECHVVEITEKLKKTSQQQLDDASKRFTDAELEMQRQISDKVATIAELEATIQSLTKSMEESKNQSTEESNHLNELIATKDGNIEELSQKVAELEQTLQEKEAKHKTQVEELHAAASKKEQSVTESLEKYKCEVETLQKEKGAIEENWRSKYASLEQTHEKNNTQLIKSKQEVDADNQALKDKLSEVSKESAALAAENEALKTKSDQVEAVHQGLKNEVEKLVKQLSERDGQVTQLRDKCDKHDEVVKQLTTKRAAESDHLQKSIQELKQREVDTKKVLETINAEVEQLTIQLEEAKKDKQVQEAAHATEIARFESEISKLKVESSQASDKVESMKFELQSDLAIEKQMRLSDVAKLESEVGALNEIIESKKIQLNEKEDEIQHLKNLIDKWEYKTEILQKRSGDAHELKKKHAGVVAELNDKISFQKEQISNLEFQLKEQLNDPIFTNIDLGIVPSEINTRALQPSSLMLNTSPSKKPTHKKKSVSPYKIDRSKSQRFNSADVSPTK